MNIQELSESSIEHEILVYLNSLDIGFFWKNTSSGFFNGKFFKKHKSPFAINGTSDILGILKNGKFCAFEVKNNKGRANKAQEAFTRKILEFGGVAGLVRSPSDAQKILRSFGFDVLGCDRVLATWKQ